jgi:isopentenyl-diphosphate delta-isomerase
VKGLKATVAWLRVFFDELRLAMFLSNASSVEEIPEKQVVITGRTREWLEQLGYKLTKGQRQEQ